MSRFLRITRLALKSLLLHKLRSGLTMLGIVFGVFSVIAMLAVGEGASQQAQDQVLALGATNVIVRTVKPNQDASTNVDSGTRIHEFGLLDKDLADLRAIPTITQFVPMKEQNEEIRWGRNRAACRLVGCTPAFREVNRLSVESGVFVTDTHVDDVQNVAVLAEELARELFGFEDPVGREVTVGTDSYEVVGVMHHRTASAAVGGSMAGQDYDKDVYVPITTFRGRRTDQNIQRSTGSMTAEYVELSQITLVVGDDEKVIGTAQAVREAIERNHPERDYAVVVPLELLQQARQIRTIFNVVLGSIAAISLVVGGIGIMNIMLATVTERTREIGVRRALGATQDDITSQFLTETIVLSGTGGIIGVALGLLTPWVFKGVQWFVAAQGISADDDGNQLAKMFTEMEPTIAWWSLPLAFGFSVATGILFGLYPARSAARLDPIEALRHE